MALHLNLHHEIEKKKAQNRRDPLKLSIYAICAVVALFVAYYAYELSVQAVLSSEMSGRKAQLEKLEPLANAAAKEEQQLQAEVKLSETLVKRVEGRFYWANVLDSLVQIVPREIQLTKLAGEVSPDKLKKCSMTLEGLSAGPEPRRVAEELRRALIDKFGAKYRNVVASFKVLEDGREMARVGNQQLPTATFAINLQLQAGEEEVVAAPVKRSPKKAPETL